MNNYLQDINHSPEILKRSRSINNKKLLCWNSYMSYKMILIAKLPIIIDFKELEAAPPTALNIAASMKTSSKLVNFLHA